MERRVLSLGFLLCPYCGCSPVLLGLFSEPVSVNHLIGAQGQECFPGLFDKVVFSWCLINRLMQNTDSFCL